MTGWEWVEDHARLLMMAAAFVLGAGLIVLGNGAAVFPLALFAYMAYLSLEHPENELAIQEDSRAIERRHLKEAFARCLEEGGLEPDGETSSLECVTDEPPTFSYWSMAYGATEDELDKVCAASLPAFGAVRYSMTRERKPEADGLGYLVAFHKTSETEALDGLAVPYEAIAGEQPTYKRIPVGLYENGNTAFVSFDNRNALVGGLPRSGKSVLLSVIIAGLCRCPYERIIVISPKILDFQAFARRVELYSAPDEMLDALRSVNGEIEKRKRYCERTGRKKIDEFNDKVPHIVIIVDEYAVIRSSQTMAEDGKKPRKIGIEIEQELFAIVSQGAFAGCQVCLTSQRLSSNVISTDLRDICAGNLICFSNGAETSDQMVFGDYASMAPASQIPIKAKGVGYLFAEGYMERPKLFKCAITDTETERRIADENQDRRPET